MPRPSFSINIGASGVKLTNGSQTQTFNVGNARHCEETIGQGTSPRKKPAGWVPPVGYSFDRVEYQMLNGISNLEFWNGNRERYVGYFDINTLNRFNEAYILNPSWSSYSDKALVKARLAMKDTSVNLGVAFAERNATARMVGDNAIAIAKAYRNLRRGEWRKAARDLGINKPRKPRGSSVTNRWLELQYGWKPLLSDVYGACDALAKRNKHDWMVTGKGHYAEDIHKFATGGSSQSATSTECHGKVGSFVRIDAMPQNELLQSMTALGLTNPLLIAWELVPYSFVVDWFLPVGSYLDSLDAMLGYGPTWCSSTNYAKLKWTTRGRDGTFNGSTFWIKAQNATRAHKNQVYVRRSVSQSVPLPTLPRFKDPASLGHMANGLALLASAFGRSGR